ncbi:FkbM family methyltransferase, partial [candidate division KSB1 bacterium]
MKRIIQKYLQGILGFENYLFVFSIFIISTLRFNRKERDFLHFLNLIPDNSTILDIGANIGIMTVHFARKLKKSNVFSIEPVPENVKALRRIIGFYKLKNVKVINIALGNRNGEVEMVLPIIQSVKMQGLSHVLHPDIKGFEDGQHFKATIKKLD